MRTTKLSSREWENNTHDSPLLPFLLTLVAGWLGYRLIEGKPVGILSLLEESCRFDSDDRRFVSKLKTGLRRHTHFRLGSVKQGRNAFVVRHCAQDVVYQAEGFIAKNMDMLPAHLATLGRVRHAA